ncbi:hypothetical protein [Xenorhabdus anantnagensis]|uniref:Uncharacterized protein n=1 Tax=Xenorhabdus anantnagensis TaxID=3025875 RepID=A0ABT5LZ15_9GAMM|nr:hypothetical protein [Xenorhabdus anantnagensis]MDC9599001.1 hypothetical protein [Xenorhabdus anantnagensis]
MKSQMQLAQEAIARLKSMSRQELLSELVTAGIAEERSPFAFTEFMVFPDVKGDIVSYSSKEHELCLSF